MPSRASLVDYDGSAGVMVDTNVWIDCIDSASPWHSWAVDSLQAHSERCPLHVNPIVYAELLVPQPEPAALDALLDVYDTVRSPLPWASAALVARAYAAYRRRGAGREKPLPDFFIGAHAAVANLAVLTRNPAGFSPHFPRLRLFGPDSPAARP